MRLLMFTPYYPPHIGGLESHAYEFSLHMAEHGHEITIVTFHIPSHSPSHEQTGKNITIIRLPAFEITPGYPIPKFWLSVYRHQMQMIKKYHYDVVCSRTRFFISSLMALIVAKRKRLPYLHIEHGSDFVQHSNFIIRTIARLCDMTIGKTVILSANAVVANSVASAIFVQKLTNNKVQPSVIYRGVEKDRLYTIAPNTSYRTAHKDKVIIGFIGRLMAGKGVADLLVALSRIKKSNIVCLIIGDGPQKSQLMSQAKELGLMGSHVLFLGEKPPQEAISILKIADIIVNPSYTEGLPTSVTEAALCHKAIIATNVGGTSEIITHNKSGLLYNPGDITTLASLLTMLVNNPGMRHDLGTKAYDEVKNKFDWQTSIEAYESILNSLTK